MKSAISYQSTLLKEAVREAALLHELERLGCYTIEDFSRLRLNTLINNKIIVKRWSTVELILLRLHQCTSAERGSTRGRRK